MKWNFKNKEACDFRGMKFPRHLLKGKTDILPRYINQIDSLAIDLRSVNIKFIVEENVDEYEFQISVFEKPSDLDFKCECLDAKQKFNKEEHILKVKGKLSYFYGNEILINFEDVYQALIRDKTLEIVMERFKGTFLKNWILYYLCI